MVSIKIAVLAFIGMAGLATAAEGNCLSCGPATVTVTVKECSTVPVIVSTTSGYGPPVETSSVVVSTPEIVSTSDVVSTTGTPIVITTSELVSTPVSSLNTTASHGTTDAPSSKSITPSTSTPVSVSTAGAIANAAKVGLGPFVVAALAVAA